MDKDTAVAVGKYIAAAVAGLGVGFVVAQKLGGRVNRSQALDTDKIVHQVDVEDIADKKVYCRCWKSSSFPYCDGSHNAHNKTTGDNVGPLIVKHKAK